MGILVVRHPWGLAFRKVLKFDVKIFAVDPCTPLNRQKFYVSKDEKTENLLVLETVWLSSKIRKIIGVSLCLDMKNVFDHNLLLWVKYPTY